MGLNGPLLRKFGIDPRSQKRRVLTFVLDGRQTLPPDDAPPPHFAVDPGFHPDAAKAAAGEVVYDTHCMQCHGFEVVSATHAPDLRRSAVPTSSEAFASVVRDGALIPGGMPAFVDLSDQQRESVRHYIRTVAQRARAQNP